MLSAAIELVLGLLCIGIAGRILIRLLERQRQAGRRNE